MTSISLLLFLVVLSALVFDYSNGFHDTANAIATVVSTRALSPRNAILMAAVLNFVGATVSQSVAKTISGGLVEAASITQAAVLAAVIGALAWNLLTWYFGIPSSSSHALIGGLCGAAMARSGWNVVIWFGAKPGDGLVPKVLIPLVLSPIAGFVLGFALMVAIYVACGRMRAHRVSRTFRIMQVASSSAVAFAHGSNDAQKSMGIITLALVAAGYLHRAKAVPVPTWVIVLCAVAMALGTSAGGWRIIRTMGHRIIRLEPVHGFAAELSAAAVIFGAGLLGMPVSTTHVISGSIFGVGTSKRVSAVRWSVAQRMVIAWVLTLPCAALAAAAVFEACKAFGLQ